MGSLAVFHVVAVGALLASFVRFLGMSSGVAISVGFGIVLLLDLVRALILDSSRSDRFGLDEIA